MINKVQMIFETKYYKEKEIRELELIMQIAKKISNCLSTEEMELITNWLESNNYEVLCALDYQLHPANYSKFIAKNELI